MYARRCVLALAILLPAWEAAIGRAASPEQPPAASTDGSPLAGTERLTWTGDIASRMVEGVDRFLLNETAKSLEKRAGFWHRDTSSAARYEASIEPNRQRLRHILGVRDPRVPFSALERVGTTSQPVPVGSGDGYQIFAVRWPAFGDVSGEGLLLVPDAETLADVVAIPDADQTPEMLVGLAQGVPASSQFARRLAESGCRVLVPTLISRQVTHFKLSNREFLYRSAYELGRHLAGYELQKVLAGVDWFSEGKGVGSLCSLRDRRETSTLNANKDSRPLFPKIGVIGYGEGGMLALYAGALDPRIRGVCVSGYFASRQNVWQEPLYRNVFGLLEQFGDAELAAMIAPRGLVVEAAKAPELVVPPGTGGGPGRLVTPALDEVRAEVARAPQLSGGLEPAPRIELVESGGGSGPYGCDDALQRFLDVISPGAKLKASGRVVQYWSRLPSTDDRQTRQVHELDRHNQWLLTESPYVRQEFLAKLDTSSPAAFQKSAATYRDLFYNEVIGRFDQPLLPPRPRTRKSYEGKNWTGYEVVLDVLPERLRLRRAVGAQGSQAGPAAAGGGLPAWAGGPADRRFLRRFSLLSRFRRPAGRSGFCHLRPAEPLSLRRPFPHLAAEGQPHQKDALLDHRAAAPADRGLAGQPALCRPAADRLLRALLRRQDGDARAGVGLRLLPVDLLRRLQRMGLEVRLRAVRPIVMCGPASTRCSSSTWAAPSTTRRWPP